MRRRSPLGPFEIRVRIVMPWHFLAFGMGVASGQFEYVELLVADGLAYAVHLTALALMLPVMAACAYVWGCDQAEANLMARVRDCSGFETRAELRRSTTRMMFGLSIIPVYAAPALVERVLG